MRPSDVFLVKLILLWKAIVKTRKTRTLSFAALWRELEDVYSLASTGESAMRFTCRCGLKQRGSSQGREGNVRDTDHSTVVEGTVTSDALNTEQNNCQQSELNISKYFVESILNAFFFWQKDISI